MGVDPPRDVPATHRAKEERQDAQLLAAACFVCRRHQFVSSSRVAQSDRSVRGNAKEAIKVAAAFEDSDLLIVFRGRAVTSTYCSSPTK